jgi:hypothetical protein
MPRYEYALPEVKDPTRDYALVVDTDDAALHNQLLHDSLAYFAKHMLGMDVAELHLEWSEAASSCNRLAIQAPRDHGKSAFWSYAYPIWQAWRNPGSLGYIISSNAGLAEDLLSIIKEGHSGHSDDGDEGGQGGLKGLLDHPTLGHLADTKNGWNKREIRLTNGSVIRARGYGARLRGGHPHWITVDDGLDERSMYSEIQREKTKTYFRSAITNMVLKGGQIVVVGTPFHRDDLYSFLASNKRYKFILYRALIEDPSAPLAPDGSGKRYRALWPERHSVAELLAKKEEIGAIDFAREILCEPITDDLTLFPSSLFVGEVMAQHVPCALTREQIEQLGWDVFLGVDLAVSANTGADFFRIVVLAQDRKYNKYVIDLYGGKGISYKKQKQLLIDVCTRYQPAAVMIEAVAYQEVFGDELIEDTDIPIIKYKTGAEKNNLQTGVPMLRRLIENKKLRFARGNERAIKRTELIISELQCFGFVGGKLRGVGSHDDCVMALWFAVMAARQEGSFKMAFGSGTGASLDEQIVDDDAPEPPVPVLTVEDDEEDGPDFGGGGFMF